MNTPERMDEEQKVTFHKALGVLEGRSLDLGGPQGKGYTPRSIEVPWAASHVKAGNTILDIGFSLSNLDYLGMLLEAREKYGVTLDVVDIIRPEQVKNRYPAEWQDAIFSVPITIGDVRTSTLPQEKYDTVLCISTLEHICYDVLATTVEDSAFERPSTKEEAEARVRDPGTNKKVLDAFHGALKIGGRACISVPMGKGEPIVTEDSKGLWSTEWEFEARSWEELTRDPRFEIREEIFFKNTPEGWVQVASPAELADVTGAMNPKMGVGFAMCVLAKK